MTVETPSGDEKSGSQLRAEFEETRRVLVDKYVAENPGLVHTDFNGIPATQFDAKAVEVKAARDAEAQSLLKRALEAKGVAEGDLDKVLAALTTGEKSAERVETPASRVASLQKLGAPPARTDVRDTSNLSGRARIEAARRRKLES